MDLFAEKVAEAPARQLAVAVPPTPAPAADQAGAEQQTQDPTAPSQEGGIQSRPRPTLDSYPDSWARELAGIPMAFRRAVIAGALVDYDQTLALMMKSKDRPLGMQQMTAESSCFSRIAYSRFLPYHLIGSDELERAKAMELLTEDPHKMLMWLKSRRPDAPKPDRLLIVGDRPKPNVLMDALDEDLLLHPADTLLCGPGSSVESLLREFGREREWVTFHIQSIDHEANGSNWDQVPGRGLDVMIDRLFNELKPDRVMAFEPVRSPACELVITEAHRRKLPVAFNTPSPALKLGR